MNKYKQLIQLVIKQAIMSGIVSAVAIVLYVGVSMLESKVSEDQKNAESKLQADKTMLSSLNTQMDKSGDAEKRYLALVEKRPVGAADFSGKLDDFKAWLIKARDFYHLQMSEKLSTDPEAPSDKPELVNLQGYNVTLRPKFKFDFQTVSDMHVFSLLEDLQNSAPGLIRIDGVSVKRSAEMTDSIIDGLRNGQVPMLVQATVELSVIGVREKEIKKDDKNASSEAQKK